MNTRYMELMANMGACTEAKEWAATQDTPQKAWDACERGDWMLWWCGMLSGAPEGKGRKRLVLAECECARLSLKYVKKGEDRPLRAIETAERWAHGKATIAEVRTAAATYDVSCDVSCDVSYAVSHAVSSASAYDATNAAISAAYAVSHAVSSASAADSRKNVLAQCADIIRKHYPKPPMKEAK